MLQSNQVVVSTDVKDNQRTNLPNIMSLARERTRLWCEIELEIARIEAQIIDLKVAMISLKQRRNFLFQRTLSEILKGETND